MENKNIWLWVAVGILAILVVVGFFKPQLPLGVSGNQFYNGLYTTAFKANSSASTTLTAGGTVTITAAKVCGGGIINFDPTTPTVGSTTLPSLAAMSAQCLPDINDRTSFIFRNLSSATTTQLIAGASTTMIAVAAADDLIGTSGWTIVEFVKGSGQEMIVIVNDLINSD